MTLTNNKSLIACVNKCQPNEKICGGCGRTEKERLEWNSYSDERKREIIKRLKPWNNARKE